MNFLATAKVPSAFSIVVIGTTVEQVVGGEIVA
jgi:hypothetical protein